MKILLVEDQAKISSFIAKGLKEEFYSVDVAEDGKKGLRLARLNEYDLYIFDIMLPEISGLEITKQLRKDGSFTPILLLTAKVETEDKIAGLDAGADDYLTKPFAFGELLARVRALLRRKNKETDNVLKIVDLTIDTVAHRVERDGKVIELTVKEYSLLEYLVRNKGRVLTRTAIVEHVWDMNFDSDTNLVDVFIHYLRKKVDDGFELKLIHTVRGVGYVFKES